MDEFITPPNHENFKAKRLFDSIGEIIDWSIAYVDLNGGGPKEKHTHEHNHLFIVTQGEAKIFLDDEEIIVKKRRIVFGWWNHTPLSMEQYR